MIPAMQIHLFDCKSTDSLASGLAQNRLQLCMLVLIKLRETYWSAGVMYRLFERAQRILQESKANKHRTVPDPASTSVHHGTHVEAQLTSIHPAQDCCEPNASLIDTILTDWQLSSDQMDTGVFWDNPFSFDNTDELLNPVFGLPDDAFHFQGSFPAMGT
jgi:hypothetical protein